MKAKMLLIIGALFVTGLAVAGTQDDPGYLGTFLKLGRYNPLPATAMLSRGTLIWDDAISRPRWSDSANWVGIQPAFPGSTTVDLPSIPAGTCGTDVTFVLGAALAGDACAVGPVAAVLATGLMVQCYSPSNGNAALHACCVSGAACDAPSALYNVTVWTP